MKYTEQCRGTEQYLGPEVLCSSQFSKKTDIWSLGCILYELNSGEPAFKSYNDVFGYTYKQRTTPRLTNIRAGELGTWLQSPVHAFVSPDTEDVYTYLINEWLGSAPGLPVYQAAIIDGESILQTMLRRTNSVLQLALDCLPDNRPSVGRLLEYVTSTWVFCSEIEVFSPFMVELIICSPVPVPQTPRRNMPLDRHRYWSTA
jgi:serine/threonine protein kinase